MARILLACSAISLLRLELLWARPAYADHESRDRILSGTGVEVVLIVVVLLAAVAVMVALPQASSGGSAKTNMQTVTNRTDF